MLRGLHFLMTLSVPLLLLALMSCIKAKEEPADLGPEASEDQIELALSKAINGADVSHTAVGQYVTYSILRRLENDDSTQSLGATKVEVFDKTESATDTRFTLRIVKSTRMDDGTFETVQTEEPLTIKKGASTLQAVNAVNSLFSPLLSTARASTVNATAAKPIRKSYHRLRESSAEIDPPPLVKNRSGCGGLNPCKIPVHYVQYDLVEWYSETEFRKLAFDLSFSTVTPFLPFGENIDRFSGLMLTNCVSTQVQITGRTVYVRDCINLEDLQK